MNSKCLILLLNIYKSFCNLILLYADMCTILNIFILLYKCHFLWSQLKLSQKLFSKLLFTVRGLAIVLFLHPQNKQCSSTGFVTSDYIYVYAVIFCQGTIVFLTMESYRILYTLILIFQIVWFAYVFIAFLDHLKVLIMATTPQK